MKATLYLQQLFLISHGIYSYGKNTNFKTEHGYCLIFNVSVY